MSDKGHDATRLCMSEEARRGPFFWGHDRTTYSPSASIPSVATGGTAKEFDRMISLAIEHEKFPLLTPIVSDIARTQYGACWKRRSGFCACVGANPWVRNFEPGRGNAPIDFPVGGYKLMGVQFGTLAKRFFAIRCIRITDVLGDLSPRAHRIRSFIKATERRGAVYKKVP